MSGDRCYLAGPTKAAKEEVVRYYAIMLAKSGIMLNTVSPRISEDSVLSDRPKTSSRFGPYTLKNNRQEREVKNGRTLSSTLYKLDT